MKAVLSHAPGGPETLRYDDAPEPQPGPGQVVVDVNACGVNFPDTLIIRDLYQFKPERPFAPGGEIAGVVAGLGPDVTGVAVGERIAAMTIYGGFAEKVACPAQSLVKLPGAIDFETAAALLMTYGTSLHALQDRAQLKAGETLVVLGAAGGVGLAAVELGAAMGARVIAAASTEEKLQVCRAYGASDTILYPNPPFDRDTAKAFSAEIKSKTGGGADVIYDPVGGAYAEPAIRAMAWRGRYLVVGFAAGEIPKIPLNLALLKGCSVVGVFWGQFTMSEPEANRADIAQLLDCTASGKIKPRVAATYPLKDAARALEDLSARRVAGNLVLVP